MLPEIITIAVSDDDHVHYVGVTPGHEITDESQVLVTLDGGNLMANQTHVGRMVLSVVGEGPVTKSQILVTLG